MPIRRRSLPLFCWSKSQVKYWKVKKGLESIQLDIVACEEATPLQMRFRVKASVSNLFSFNWFLFISLIWKLYILLWEAKKGWNTSAIFEGKTLYKLKFFFPVFFPFFNITKIVIKFHFSFSCPENLNSWVFTFLIFKIYLKKKKKNLYDFFFMFQEQKNIFWTSIILLRKLFNINYLRKLFIN